MIWYKAGVAGDLQPVARRGLGVVHAVYNAKRQDLFVTSIRDGEHSMGSLHYDGLAFDIRYNNGIHSSEVSLALGEDWDVVPEEHHIHCEYDPK